MVEDYTVREGLWDSATRIAKIDRKRHTCIFPESDEPTKVTYCNNCGSAFIVIPNNAKSGLPNKCAKCWEDQ